MSLSSLGSASSAAAAAAVAGFSANDAWKPGRAGPAKLYFCRNAGIVRHTFLVFHIQRTGEYLVVEKDRSGPLRTFNTRAAGRKLLEGTPFVFELGDVTYTRALHDLVTTFDDGPYSVTACNCRTFIKNLAREMRKLGMLNKQTHDALLQHHKQTVVGDRTMTVVGALNPVGLLLVGLGADQLFRRRRKQ